MFAAKGKTMRGVDGRTWREICPIHLFRWGEWEAGIVLMQMAEFAMEMAMMDEEEEGGCDA